MRLAVIFLALLSSSLAATKYYAQSAAGANDGSSAANAYSAAQFNAASPYSPAGDDFLILNGNVTTPLVIPTSGTSGHPITIQFASGATMSKGNWNQSGTNQDSAIYVNGKSYITIDGQNVGIIEATTNGTGLATSLICYGITFDGSFSGAIVKNITVRNMYVRTNGLDGNYYGACVQIGAGTGWTGSNALIDNCILNNCGQPVAIAYTSATNVEVKNCTISHGGTQILIGSTGVGATLTGCLVHDNVITTYLDWSGSGGVHKEMIHFGAVSASSQLNGVKCYNNQFLGDAGDNSTAFVFVEGFVYSPLVYCNLFAPTTANGPGLGFVCFKGSQDPVCANNTWRGVSNASFAVYTAINGLTPNLIFENNVETVVGTQINDNASSVALSDRNCFYQGDVTGFYRGVTGYTFAGWKALTGFDSNSVTTDPLLDGNNIPQTGSPANGSGADMSAYYTTDAAGRAWSANAGWGMGWKQFSGGGSAGGSAMLGKTSLTGKVTIR